MRAEPLRGFRAPVGEAAGAHTRRGTPGSARGTASGGCRTASRPGAASTSGALVRCSYGLKRGVLAAEHAQPRPGPPAGDPPDTRRCARKARPAHAGVRPPETPPRGGRAAASAPRRDSSARRGAATSPAPGCEDAGRRSPSSAEGALQTLRRGVLQEAASAAAKVFLPRLEGTAAIRHSALRCLPGRRVRVSSFSPREEARDRGWRERRESRGVGRGRGPAPGARHRRVRRRGPARWRRNGPGPGRDSRRGSDAKARGDLRDAREETARVESGRPCDKRVMRRLFVLETSDEESRRLSCDLLESVDPLR